MFPAILSLAHVDRKESLSPTLSPFSLLSFRLSFSLSSPFLYYVLCFALGFGGLCLVQSHVPLDVSDGFAWVESLWAGLRAVHDGVAAVHREGILELGPPLLSELVL